MRSRQVSKQKRLSKQGPVQAQSQKAPGGAQRCRVLASRICLQHPPQRGFGILVGLLGGILVAEFGGCRQEIGRRVKVRAGWDSSRQRLAIDDARVEIEIALGGSGDREPIGGGLTAALRGQAGNLAER